MGKIFTKPCSFQKWSNLRTPPPPPRRASSGIRITRRSNEQTCATPYCTPATPYSKDRRSTHVPSEFLLMKELMIFVRKKKVCVHCHHMALPRHDGGRTIRPRSFATALVERVPKSEQGDMCDHARLSLLSEVLLEKSTLTVAR